MAGVWRMIRDSLAQNRNPSPEVAAEKARWEAWAMGQAAHVAPGGGVDPGEVTTRARAHLARIATSVLMPEPSGFVKRTTCAACGANKELPSVREHLYCDFCGQVVDYDLRQAMATAHATPTVVEYAQLNNQLNPQAMAAVGRGDVETFRRARQALFEAQTAWTPWAVPPRAWNDEDYRQAWVRHQTELAVLTAFDPTHAQLEARVRQLVMGLRWTGGNMMGMAAAAMRGQAPGPGSRPMVEPASFWPLVEVLLAQAERVRTLVDGSEVRALDPDQTAGVVADRLHRSGLAQGWLPSLPPEDGERFIAMLGLDFAYQRPTVTGRQVDCAACGYHLTALEGARTMVCDQCGRRVAVGAAIGCRTCGDTIALPEGADEAACPSCAALVRRV